jgi:hypothetical protein
LPPPATAMTPVVPLSVCVQVVYAIDMPVCPAETLMASCRETRSSERTPCATTQRLRCVTEAGAAPILRYAVAPMRPRPLHFLLLVFAGWVNRRQVAVIEYLKEENRILREQLQGRQRRFTDVQRRRLAIRGHALARRALLEVTSLITPDTILRW